MDAKARPSVEDLKEAIDNMNRDEKAEISIAIAIAGLHLLPTAAQKNDMLVAALAFHRSEVAMHLLKLLTDDYELLDPERPAEELRMEVAAATEAITRSAKKNVDLFFNLFDMFDFGKEEKKDG